MVFDQTGGGGEGSGPDLSKPNPYFEMSNVEFTVTAEVGADLFNFGLTVYSTNTKAGLAPWAL